MRWNSVGNALLVNTLPPPIVILFECVYPWLMPWIARLVVVLHRYCDEGYYVPHVYMLGHICMFYLTVLLNHLKEHC